MARYRMTPKRRAALRKAQLASARKRKKGLSRRTKRNVAIGVGTAVVLGTTIGGRHVYNKNVYSQKSTLTDQPNRGLGFANYRKNPVYKTRKVTIGVKHNFKPSLDFEHRMLNMGIVRSRDKNQNMYKTRSWIHDPMYAGSRTRSWHGGIKKKKRR